MNDGRWLERRQGSTYPGLVWHGVATVVYTPAETAETSSRERLLVDLVKLSVAYDTMKTAKTGDVSETQADYTKERDSLFAPFMSRGRRMII